MILRFQHSNNTHLNHIHRMDSPFRILQDRRESMHLALRKANRSQHTQHRRLQFITKSMMQEGSMGFVDAVNAIKKQRNYRTLERLMRGVYQHLNTIPFCFLQFALDESMMKRLIQIGEQTFTQKLSDPDIEGTLLQIQESILFILERCVDVGAKTIQAEDLDHLLECCNDSSSFLVKNLSASIMSLNPKMSPMKYLSSSFQQRIEHYSIHQIESFVESSAKVFNSTKIQFFKSPYIQRLIVKNTELFHRCFTKDTLYLLKPVLTALFNQGFIRCQNYIIPSLPLIGLSCRWFLDTQNILKNMEFIPELFNILQLIFDNTFDKSEEYSLTLQQCFINWLLPFSFRLNHLPPKIQTVYLNLLSSISRKHNVSTILLRDSRFASYLPTECLYFEREVVYSAINLIDNLAEHFDKAELVTSGIKIVKGLVNKLGDCWDSDIQIRILETLLRILMSGKSKKDRMFWATKLIEMGGIYQLGKLEESPCIQIHHLLDELFSEYLNPALESTPLGQQDDEGWETI